MNFKQLYLSLISLSLIVSPSFIATAATQKPECQNASGGNCGGDPNTPPKEDNGSQKNSSQTSSQEPNAKPHSSKQPKHDIQPHTP